MNALAVEAARGVFPWILHVYAGIVAAFDFFSADFEIVIGFRDADHSRLELRLAAWSAESLPLSAGGISIRASRSLAGGLSAAS